MTHEYSTTYTRAGIPGVQDKLVVIRSLALQKSRSRVMQERVLDIVRGSQSGADQQVLLWERYCDCLPYRRERNEHIRDPLKTIDAGGDCDDLVCLFLTGCFVLAIPAKGQIMANSDGEGYHIRALVGLPPLSPTEWFVVDPVWRSEARWNMSGRPTTLGQKSSTSGLAGAYGGSPTMPAVTCECTTPPRPRGGFLGELVAGSLVFLAVERVIQSLATKIKQT